MEVLIADLHRHTEFSLFDGFGKPLDLARLAKSYGYNALGITDHGTASGLVEHYLACKEVGIKPILGVEAYFQPTFNTEKKRYHLCIFVKNLVGYRNMCRMLSYANVHNFYYKPIITFDLLEKYHEGLIVSSACIAGYASQMIVNDNILMAEKFARKMKKMFGKDFYMEIQPYKLSTEGMQENVNERVMAIAKKHDIKCILTSDSHFGKQEDLDSYVKMHDLRNHKNVEVTYKERYMPKPSDLKNRFESMHGRNPWFTSKEVYRATEEIVDKCEEDIFKDLELTLPVYDEEQDSDELILSLIKKGLKKRGKWNKEYRQRCKKEFEIIKEHGFQDYFLIVQDYVKWAKKNGIAVGPGRGSVCNCLIAYALGITEVDSIKFGLDFRRFLRMDKKKLPDIDIDFETSRRGEVISYLIKKYKGKAVQICSYGLYKVDNLLNDLFKVCGVEDEKEKKAIKVFVKEHIDKETSEFNYEEARYMEKCKRFNSMYQNIVKHFSKMYKKVRYIGTHAAGVAVVGTNIFDYMPIERHGNNFSSAYDLNNLDKINVTKFDMLGLRTLSLVKELEELTGDYYTDEWTEDKKILKAFREGKTEAIFQFEKKQAADILTEIKTDCFEDVIAAVALNRPGPLSLGMPEQYAHNKLNQDEQEETPFTKLTKETYGTVVYQEQVMSICVNLGHMEWGESDKVMKMMKGTQMTERAQKERNELFEQLKSHFIEGARKEKIKRKEAEEIFEKMVTYTFNKGHATGYSLISVQLMYYKVYYPELFWYVSMKYASTESDEWKYKCLAVSEGNLILTPHINGTNKYSLVKIDGENCIMEGLSSIKNVGIKAAESIEEERKLNGPYKDRDDFDDRLPKRVVNARVRKALEDAGALCFDKKRYFDFVEKYNLSIASR